MNLQQLTTFCTVLSEGSMTAAAEKLLLTQPAVSQQIRSLEEEMKVSLLVRGVRQVKATVQGQLLYDYAKRILYLTQQAEIAIQSMSQEIAGHLRLGTLNSLGLYYVSPIVGTFLKHHPNLRLSINYGSYQKIIADMISGNIDVAILPEFAPGENSEIKNFENKFLVKDRMMLVGSGKDSTMPSMIELKEILLKPWLIFSDAYPNFKILLEEKLQKANIKPVTSFETDNVGTLKKVIETGLGWGFMPEHSIMKQVQMGRLVHVHVEDLRFETNIKMYSRMGESFRNMADVFYRGLQHQTLKR